MWHWAGLPRSSPLEDSPFQAAPRTGVATDSQAHTLGALCADRLAGAACPAGPVTCNSLLCDLSSLRAPRAPWGQYRCPPKPLPVCPPATRWSLVDGHRAGLLACPPRAAPCGAGCLNCGPLAISHPGDSLDFLPHSCFSRPIPPRALAQAPRFPGVLRAEKFWSRHDPHLTASLV